MIAGHFYEGSKSDIWSLGVILFALVCGFLPFEDQNTARLYHKISHAKYEAPDFISKEVKDLLRKVLCTDPRKRYTIERIRQHPWMRMYNKRRRQSVIPGWVLEAA